MSLKSKKNDTEKSKLAHIVCLAKRELQHTTPNLKIEAKSAIKMPLITGEGYFAKFDLPETNSYHYWIEWTEDLGAWIEPDGKQAMILVKESRLNEVEPIESSLVTCLTSHISATCLSLQGQIAIHANVVALDSSKDNAVAFAGDSGRGKSTLTAYCVSQGAKFVTDDVLIFDELGNARLGTSRIKLFPSMASDLGLEDRATDDYKVYYDPRELGAEMATKSLPVKIIYILEESRDRTIYSEVLNLGEAITHLISHSYHTSALIKDNPSLFEQYIDLAQRMIVKKLFYPRQLDLLPAVYSYLLQDC